MKTRVRLFAGARQAAAAEAVELELPEGATIGQLRQALAAQVPELSNMIAQMMFAVGTRYASDESQIGPGAEVACIPPVSGG
ncbi:MAG: MoaD/ThiS family protein [Thermoguttaceae bacterium]